MAIPKTQKLKAEEAVHGLVLPSIADAPVVGADTGPIKIREIKCCNEMVAILRFKHESTINLPEESQLRDEGIVVGIGPGVPASDGTRCPSQLRLGDVVMFRQRDIVTKVQAMSPPYHNANIVLVGERSILCWLKPVEFEIVQ